MKRKVVVPEVRKVTRPRLARLPSIDRYAWPDGPRVRLGTGGAVVRLGDLRLLVRSSARHADTDMVMLDAEYIEVAVGNEVAE